MRACYDILRFIEVERIMQVGNILKQHPIIEKPPERENIFPVPSKHLTGLVLITD